jgi:hypothetical protein
MKQLCFCLFVKGQEQKVGEFAAHNAKVTVGEDYQMVIEKDPVQSDTLQVSWSAPNEVVASIAAKYFIEKYEKELGMVSVEFVQEISRWTVKDRLLRPL